LQLRARRRGGGLKRKQRNGGTGVHQKILSGFLIPDKAIKAIKINYKYFPAISRALYLSTETISIQQASPVS
jgi:hypothetical protein